GGDAHLRDASLEVAQLGVEIVCPIPIATAKRIVQRFADADHLLLARYTRIAEAFRLLPRQPLARRSLLEGREDVPGHLNQAGIKRVFARPGTNPLFVLTASPRDDVKLEAFFGHRGALWRRVNQLLHA